MSIFKSKYYADPEYKAKHLARMKEKITCPLCGHIIQRANLTHHNKTSKLHENKEMIDFNRLSNEEIEKLMEKLNNLKKQT